MKPFLPSSRRVLRAFGFSLIEILAVVTIVGVLLAFTAPYVAGILASTRLKTASDSIEALLLEAQSVAVMFNTDVELRLYETRDLIDPDGAPALRRLQLHTLRFPSAKVIDEAEPEAAPEEESTFVPMGSPVTLDHSIEISSASKFTSLVDLGFEDDPADAHGRYVALRFRSDGTPRLQPNQPWFLTLHEKDALKHADKLKNFVTLQIDAVTGRLRDFQP